MKFLFIALCISVIISIAFLSFSCCKKNYKNNIQKYILKYVLTSVASLYLIFIAISLTILSIGHLILFVIACFFICLVSFVIYDLVSSEPILTVDPGIFTIVFISALAIIFSIGVLTLNFEKSDEKSSEKEILLNDYSSENKTANEKLTIIELSEDDDPKQYIIQTYTSDIELPFYEDYIDEYEIVEIEQNKIVISTKESNGTDLLVLFGFKEPDKIEYVKYTLYVDSDDILYN